MLLPAVHQILHLLLLAARLIPLPLPAVLPIRLLLLAVLPAALPTPTRSKICFLSKQCLSDIAICRTDDCKLS
jgi:hypothetical protein